MRGSHRQPGSAAPRSSAYKAQARTLSHERGPHFSCSFGHRQTWDTETDPLLTFLCSTCGTEGHEIPFPAPLTFHVSLDVVHQGLDGVGEVPRVLLDADLDQAPATDCTLLFLFELWGRKGTEVALKNNGTELFKTQNSKPRILSKGCWQDSSVHRRQTHGSVLHVHSTALMADITNQSQHSFLPI